VTEAWESAAPFDHPREACGVFGIVAPGLDVARITYFGLYALQHRGQESAGIATASGEPGANLRLHTRMGLVATAFDEQSLRSLTGTMAIGHTRYSTTGSSVAVNAGPVLTESDLGPIAVAHNGNLTNAAILRQRLEARGEQFSTSTDSEVLARVIACAPGATVGDRLIAAMEQFEGAYSCAVLTPTELYAVRDPLGLRPLSLARLEDGWTVASETCAFATTGAAFVRDIAPGEVLRVTADAGPETIALRAGERDALCVFELIYFARPDSMMGGERIHLVRQRMGAELAREQHVDADIVVPLPDSAIPAGIGYARESGIPYAEALIKNRYIGRTFIQPDQHLREVGIALKFNPLPEVLEGKRVVLVDDTIVRGTTSRPIVQLLRDAGAREVHMRVHAPPIMWPCFMGVDFASRSELIAARYDADVAEIGRQIGVDSLAYLSLDGLFRAISQPQERYCAACLTGIYPVPIYEAPSKFALERTEADMAVSAD
jgi:amidophosphoribosyltransferase